MLLLKLNKEINGKVSFDYYPQGKSKSGTIEIDKNSGEITVVSVCETDEHMIYLHHAVSRILQYFSNGKYRDDDIVAWY